MIEGEFVLLRPIKEQDIPTLHCLRNNIRIQQQLLSRPRGSSLDIVKRWASARCDNLDSIFLIVTRIGDDQCIGFVQADKIDHVDKRCEFGICLIESQHGKGLGGDSTKAFLIYLKNVWNLRKVEIRVRADNKKALSCYRKIGFSCCGTLKQHTFVDGFWFDVMIMELFLENLE
jgi:diamine N-acetyltransferase